jgi:hypothetical protein
MVSPGGTFMADVGLDGIELLDRGHGLDDGLGMYAFENIGRLRMSAAKTSPRRAPRRLHRNPV